MSVSLRGRAPSFNVNGDEYEIIGAIARRREAPEENKCSECVKSTVATCCCLTITSIAIQIIEKLGNFFSS